MTTENFEDFGLHPKLVQTVAALGYETPTPIQSAIIPAMLSRQDVIGQAQTGTGKTAAFCTAHSAYACPKPGACAMPGLSADA